MKQLAALAWKEWHDVRWFVAVAFFFGLCVTFSGSLASPVSRFHSSNVCGEIFPFTSSSANLRRCA